MSKTTKIRGAIVVAGALVAAAVFFFPQPSVPRAGGSALPFGDRADPAAAEETVRVVMRDDLSFSPPSLVVDDDSVVTFEVTNDGVMPHEFVLGDEEMQTAHEAHMASEGMGHDHPLGISVPPGETRAITWHFTQPGRILYGCHEPGHYEGGMVGTLRVR